MEGFSEVTLRLSKNYVHRGLADTEVDRAVVAGVNLAGRFCFTTYVTFRLTVVTVTMQTRASNRHLCGAISRTPCRCKCY